MGPEMGLVKEANGPYLSFWGRRGHRGGQKQRRSKQVTAFPRLLLLGFKCPPTSLSPIMHL